MPSEVQNVINSIARSINDGETTVFCGAGISRDSGFPIVNHFIPYVLLTLCTNLDEILIIGSHLENIENTQKRQEYLKQIITNKMEVSSEVLEAIINELPFEAFMETLLKRTQLLTRIHKSLSFCCTGNVYFC